MLPINMETEYDVSSLLICQHVSPQEGTQEELEQGMWVWYSVQVLSELWTTSGIGGVPEPGAVLSACETE